MFSPKPAGAATYCTRSRLPVQALLALANAPLRRKPETQDIPRRKIAERHAVSWGEDRKCYSMTEDVRGAMARPDRGQRCRPPERRGKEVEEAHVFGMPLPTKQSFGICATDLLVQKYRNSLARLTSRQKGIGASFASPCACRTSPAGDLVLRQTTRVR